MKQDMSSADVAAVVAELSTGPRSIIDAKIGKIYQPGAEEIRINLYVFHQGRKNLVIEAGKRLHMSKYLQTSPTIPQAFPMLLRKYLMGGRIVSIEQHDFDRIVKIGIERAGVRSTLIVELFAKGNILIVDPENRIILPMNPVTLKDRRLRSGEIYELPEAQLSPLKVETPDMMTVFSKSTADIVRTIATRFNLGGVLAEEICSRAGINKTKPAKEATEEDAILLCKAMHALFYPLFAGKTEIEAQAYTGREGGEEADIGEEGGEDADGREKEELEKREELEAKEELGSRAEADIETGIGKNIETEIDNDIKTDIETGIEKDIETGAKTETETESEAKAETEARFDVQALKPHHVKKEINGKLETFDVVPFELLRYADYEKEYFESFNKALDEFFGKKALDQLAEVKAAEKKEKVLGVYERRLLQQEESLAKFETNIKKNNALAETIYANYPLIEELFSILNGAREKGYSWEEIRLVLKQAKKSVPAAQKITNIDPKTGTVTVELDGKNVNLEIRKTVPQNAQEYYEKVKKFSKKRDGALKAIEDTKKNMEKKASKPSKPGKKRQISRKKHWYDHFRWFVSSDGFLVVGGRDADTNEELFKKYLEKRDIVFHTQTPGAPLTVVKTKGKEVPASTLEEVARFAVSYSSLWKAGQFSGDCYWVLAEQVTKTPESGEYLKKGAFVIRGERNYFKDVPLGIAVGLELKGETRVIGGPASAVRKHGDYIMGIAPGKFNQNDISKKIYRTYADELNDPRFVKQIASPDLIEMFMPPGESDLRSSKPERNSERVENNSLDEDPEDLNEENERPETGDSENERLDKYRSPETERSSEKESSEKESSEEKLKKGSDETSGGKAT